jgi:hypothetical protein
VFLQVGDAVRGGVEFGAAGADHFNNERFSETGIRQGNDIAIRQHIPGGAGVLRAAHSR